ncbi:hypothetical protein CLIB1444_02S12134 [[Candida] jaroonii]|uniref:Uncharacterized protein n=1 Tax=[Candida] jaroonii TaxID=467808 RepID=A0ACA9Y454_9ASCO|nr:hypothetical protein CLIB1444_02S12134 [[Candida] jaroonii]
MGVVLGQDESIVTSFEIIDLNYYYERLPQFITMFPDLKPLGLYYNETVDPSVIDDINKILLLPLIIITNSKISHSSSFIQGFIDGIETKIIIKNDEIESIALKSLNNDKNTIDKDSIINSVHQLDAFLNNLLNNLLSKEMNPEKAIKINNLVGQLCKKLKNIRDSQEDNSDLLVNELSLVTLKLSNIDKLNTQIINKMSLVTNRRRNLETIDKFERVVQMG